MSRKFEGGPVKPAIMQGDAQRVEATPVGIGKKIGEHIESGMDMAKRLAPQEVDADTVGEAVPEGGSFASLLQLQKIADELNARLDSKNPEDQELIKKWSVDEHGDRIFSFGARGGRRAPCLCRGSGWFFVRWDVLGGVWDSDYRVVPA